ncbi:MAG: succinyl-diaminopimelate desuccinylase [Burkholderiaceae bacterium]|nr:succinyl-diaminopimelate desuccinylase [Burkholderiaceae bacterium]
MHRTLHLAEQLISRPSVTPLDSDCQKIIATRLVPLGFVCETVESGPADFRVVNLWAKRDGNRASNSIVKNTPDSKLLVFAGHTDVVPTGPLEQWSSDPFVPSHRDGKLFGRGASDMKTSIAAFVVAVEEFLAANPKPLLSLAFLLTSDEEGPSVDGTVIMCQWLTERGEKLDYCIVGEPTSVERTGDMIKNGRRGTMSGKLTVKGVQGHIAYPHLAANPIHKIAPALSQLVATEWDQGNDHFPPTTWQISNIHGGTGASNVIPGHVVIDFNFRFSTESTVPGLQQRLVDVLTATGLQPGTDFDLQWTVGGLPFLTRPGDLVNAVRDAIRAETGLETQLSTTGGTSDGRFIAKICPQVLECGPPNATIHKIDEHIVVADIEPLKNIYRRTLENLEQALQPGQTASQVAA